MTSQKNDDIEEYGLILDIIQKVVNTEKYLREELNLLLKLLKIKLGPVSCLK